MPHPSRQKENWIQIMKKPSKTQHSRINVLPSANLAVKLNNSINCQIKVIQSNKAIYVVESTYIRQIDSSNFHNTSKKRFLTTLKYISCWLSSTNFLLIFRVLKHTQAGLTSQRELNFSFMNNQWRFERCITTQFHALIVSRLSSYHLDSGR